MDYNITFPEQIINNANTSGIIMISVVFVLGFIILVRYSAQVMPAVIGILAHLLFVIAGVEILTQVVAMIPGLSGLMLGSELMFCITRTVITALLVHLARWIVISFTNRNHTIEIGSAMIGGLGMGISQAVVSGMDIMYISTLGTVINTEGLPSLLEGVAAENVTTMVESIKQTVQIPPVFFLLKGINNGLDTVYFVGAAIIVYAIVSKGLSKVWYVAAIVINIALQTASMFGDYRVMDNFVMLTVIKVVTIVALCMCVFKIDSDYLGCELRSFEKMKTSKKMPKYDNLKNK